MRHAFDRRRFMEVASGTAVLLALPDGARAVEAGDLQSLIDPILRLPPATLSEVQNAYPLLQAAGKLIADMPDGEFELEDCFSPEKPDDERDRLIGAWLDEHARAIGLRVHNPLGKKIVESSLSSLHALRQATVTIQATREATRLSLGLALFARRHARLPWRLEELVDARLLDTLPPDPFGGGAFQYAADKRVLWSVGPQGDVSPDTVEEDDINARYVWLLDKLPLADVAK